MGCIDGHYALNPKGRADVGDIDMIDGDNLKTGWTGKSEEVIGELSEQELEEWDELDQAGKWGMPPERGSSFDDERDEDA